MAICPLCGKRVIAGKGNSTIVDGQLVHKNCNKNTKTKKVLTPEERQDRKRLFEAISRHLELHPMGYVAETGLNFTKLAVQVGQLKKDGYSYKDQLYALDKIVEKQGGFWGYTAVKNNIAGIIAKRDEKSLRMANFAKKQHNSDNNINSNVDLSKLIDEGNEEW